MPNYKHAPHAQSPQRIGRQGESHVSSVVPLGELLSAWQVHIELTRDAADVLPVPGCGAESAGFCRFKSSIPLVQKLQKNPPSGRILLQEELRHPARSWKHVELGLHAHVAIL